LITGPEGRESGKTWTRDTGPQGHVETLDA
jgi:hypothetical protein